MKHCYELVIYKVKPDKKPEFEKLHKCISEQLSKLDGFISTETNKSVKKSNQFVDKVLWKSEKSALNAYDAFRTFKCKDEFAKCIENVILSDHFFEDAE